MAHRGLGDLLFPRLTPLTDVAGHTVLTAIPQLCTLNLALDQISAVGHNKLLHYNSAKSGKDSKPRLH